MPRADGSFAGTGWSAARARGWDHAFGGHRHTEPLPEHVRMARLGYLDPGEVVTANGQAWIVTPSHELEEIVDAPLQPAP